MGENFSKIKFKIHRLHEDGVHGFYELDKDHYLSVCSGGGSYGDLSKMDYWVLISNKHPQLLNKIESTFEVAVVNRKSNELMDGPNGDIVKGKCTLNDVEEIIKKVKQDMGL
jgi:hypothetical protein